MTDTEIIAVIHEVARTHLKAGATLDMPTPLVEALDLDSMRMITLVAELENSLEICFEPGDEVGLVTLADLVALVRRRLP